jgi:hypothetical protein
MRFFTHFLLSISLVLHLTGRISGFMAARANKDALASHINEVVAKKVAASESMGDFETPRSNITGYAGETGHYFGIILQCPLACWGVRCVLCSR